MKIKRQSIYVAGPYRSKWGIIGRAINIWKAYQAGRRLVKQGYSVFIPHLNTAFMDGLQDDDFFLEAGLKIIPKFQVLYLLKGWTKSQGAVMEYQKALIRGMTIWYENPLDKPDNVVNRQTAIEDTGQWCQAIVDRINFELKRRF